jgi:hypothetical protein
MADKYYVANNGLGSTTSWSLTPFGATGAAVPVDGDDVYFQSLTGELSGGLNTFETGVPASITVGKGCNLFIAAGSSMSIGDGTNTCGTIIYEGSGSQWAFTAAAANAIDDINVNTFGVVTITKTTGANSLDNVYIDRGIVNIRGTLKPNISNFGGIVDSRGGGTVGVLDCNAGRTVTSDNVTTLNATGSASVTVDETASVTTANVTGSPDRVRVNLRSVGTTTTLNQKGGMVTPDGALGSHTITNANIFGTNATTSFVTKVGLSEFDLTNPPVYFGTVSPKSSDSAIDFGGGA